MKKQLVVMMVTGLVSTMAMAAPTTFRFRGMVNGVPQVSEGTKLSDNPPELLPSRYGKLRVQATRYFNTQKADGTFESKQEIICDKTVRAAIFDKPTDGRKFAGNDTAECTVHSSSGSAVLGTTGLVIVAPLDFMNDGNSEPKKFFYSQTYFRPDKSVPNQNFKPASVSASGVTPDLNLNSMTFIHSMFDINRKQSVPFQTDDEIAINVDFEEVGS